MNWLFGRLLEQVSDLVDRSLLMVPELEEPAVGGQTPATTVMTEQP